MTSIAGHHSRHDLNRPGHRPHWFSEASDGFGANQL